LSLTLSGSPVNVVIARDNGVPDDAWRTLERNLAPGSLRVINHEFVVPIDSFLARRNWLAHTLIAYGCEAVFDTSILTLLQREEEEEVEVAEALLRSRDEWREIDPGMFGSGNRFRHDGLRPFQTRDLGRILSLSHGANFSVPGAGKTAVALGCYEALRLEGRVERLLVIAPLSAFDSWTTECEQWMEPAPRIAWLDNGIPHWCEILLVNYQRLAARYRRISEWVASRPCHVILDEAHRIKRGRNGEWGTACLDLSYLAARRDILTGTPAPQHPSDFIALLDFLWPQQSSRILPAAALQVNPPDFAMAEVSDRIGPLFARTTKDELGLTPPRLRVEYVDMGPAQTAIYDAVRSRMLRQIRLTLRARAQLARVADVVMYLIEAATNPALLAPALGGSRGASSWPPSPVPDDASVVDVILDYYSYEMPRKFEKLATIVAENASAGRKTLVWSNFVANLEELGRRILAPYRPALIYGAIPSSPREMNFVTRQSELNRFRHDSNCMVLLANPAAMSEGVSLHHECHDAVYLDRTFNAGQYLQSIDRIHRLGLRPGTETRITSLVSSGTVDEIIDQRVRMKAERLSQMLSDPNLTVMALPDPDDYGQWVETTDLDELFGHLGIER
jgi:SNF2 family DNA or RNA helicase